MTVAKAARVSQDLSSLVAAVDALDLYQGRSLIDRFGRCATGDAPADRFYPEGRPLKAATEPCGYGTRKDLLRRIAAACQ